MSGEAATVVQAGVISGGVHLGRPAVAPSPPRPVREWHPFDLDVHRAVGPAELPYLPAYLPRAHDAALAGWLRAPSTGMAVLTGESSTGKTRALYEAVTTFLPTWPLVYPRTAEDLLRVLAGGVEPGTVLWLNETQNHLDGATGEQAAVALRTLLELPGPFVVLGTMWPRHWSSLVKNPQAGALLEHRVERIRVADRLDAAELAGVPAGPRLLSALTTAHDGRVIQVVAGGPALVERHEHPDTPEDRYATAIVTAALDARRLGHRSPLPAGLLAAAAPGYLAEEDRVGAPDTWFAEGMAVAVNGRTGVAALIPRRRGPGIGPPDGYEVHDYLDQHGRTARRWARTPDSLWDALVAHTTEPEDRFRLALNAYHRLRYRHADPLYREAAATGSPYRSEDLVTALVAHGRVDEVADLARRVPPVSGARERPEEAHAGPAHASDASEPGYFLADALAGAGRFEDAIDVLRRMVAHGAPGAVEELADLLAARGRWDEALAVVRDAEPAVAARWLAARFAAAGNEERLRQLDRVRPATPPWWAGAPPRRPRPPAPRSTAVLRAFLAGAPSRARRVDLVREWRDALPFDGPEWLSRLLADLLAAEGRWAEALDLARRASWGEEWAAEQFAAVGNASRLRALADTECPPAQRELAALLAGRRAFDELLDRTAKGDEHCARQLVALAVGGELPGGRELLADGL